MSQMNEIASKHLGQQGSYAITTDKFDPSFLVPMPRSLARGEWGIKGDEFIGYDVWHCHEATFLTDNGLPVAGTLKIVIPASSEFMVESKSFKLYLNTFDMCKMGATINEAIINYEKQVANDIKKVVGVGNVEVKFFKISDATYSESDPATGFYDIYNLLSPSNLEGMVVSDYQAKDVHFRVDYNKENHKLFKGDAVKVYTNVLRSRCRHTKQKDTGAAYFSITTKKGSVDLEGLLKEVIALREVNEFHEFCCEKLFTTIAKHPDVENCMVMLLYSRRGSLDINPVRSTNLSLIPTALIDPELYTKKALGQ